MQIDGRIDQAMGIAAARIGLHDQSMFDDGPRITKLRQCRLEFVLIIIAHRSGQADRPVDDLVAGTNAGACQRRGHNAIFRSKPRMQLLGQKTTLVGQARSH